MQLRHPLRLIGLGLILGVAFDVFFHHSYLGLSLPLYALLTLAALGMVMQWEGSRPLRGNLWLPAALLFFAVMVFVRASFFLTFLNVCTSLLLLALIARHLTRRPAAAAGIIEHGLTPLLTPLLAAVHGASAIQQGVHQGRALSRRTNRRALLPILRGMLIAAPLLLLFGLLLASADAIFAEVLRRFLPADLVAFLNEWLGRSLIIAGVGFLGCGGLSYAIQRDEPGKDSLGALLPHSLRFLGAIEAVVALSAVNLLFALFVIVQIPYLFGGQVNITPAGFTYAEYARRGFGELLLVALAVLGVIMLLETITRRESGRQNAFFNLSSTLLVTLTVVILISAFKRLLLYEYAYGFTELRLYAHVFMVWLGLGLGWFVIALWLRPCRQRGRFAIGLLTAALGFVATLNLLNPDVFIVRQNLARHGIVSAQMLSLPPDAIISEEATLDYLYFTELSEDATPLLVTVVDRLEGEQRQALDLHLRSRYEGMQQDTAWRRWQALHLARLNAFRSLQARYAPSPSPAGDGQ